jgi:Transmembrane secretion effector
MDKTATNTWIALRNSVFRRFWFATVISGSCVAAQKTAIYWALNALGASTVLISMMAAVSALPGALFTLPAGAIADMVDRKKILLAVQLRAEATPRTDLYLRRMGRFSNRPCERNTQSEIRGRLQGYVHSFQRMLACPHQRESHPLKRHFLRFDRENVYGRRIY